jgi:thiol-disulfide isomerase/thioredoxin
VVDSNHRQYTIADFKQKGNFFLFMFNPTCGHCIQMAKLISDHQSDFAETNILFMAGGNMQPYMPSFYQASSIAKAPAVIVALDSSSTIEKLMVFQGLPQLNIYDSTGTLIKIKTGDIPIDTLKYYRGY